MSEPMWVVSVQVTHAKQHIYSIVSMIGQGYEICYLSGDYNIHLLNVDFHRLT